VQRITTKRLSAPAALICQPLDNATRQPRSGSHQAGARRQGRRSAAPTQASCINGAAPHHSHHACTQSASPSQPPAPCTSTHCHSHAASPAWQACRPVKQHHQRSGEPPVSSRTGKLQRMPGPTHGLSRLASAHTCRMASSLPGVRPRLRCRLRRRRRGRRAGQGWGRATLTPAARRPPGRPARGACPQPCRTPRRPGRAWRTARPRPARPRAAGAAATSGTGGAPPGSSARLRAGRPARVGRRRCVHRRAAAAAARSRCTLARPRRAPSGAGLCGETVNL